MNYRIIYSSRRTMAIEITRDCEVVVRASYRTKAEKIEAFVLKNEDWITAHLNRRIVQKSRYPEPSEEEFALLKEKAVKIIPEKIEYFSEIMGVYPSRVSINRAKTRFGSCSAEGSLNFSCRIMMYPEEAIDYVVVHELAHLKYLNHSKDFWA